MNDSPDREDHRAAFDARWARGRQFSDVHDKITRIAMTREAKYGDRQGQGQQRTKSEGVEWI
jgi:hypothetical protein